jgi:hypothetical protein
VKIVLQKQPSLRATVAAFYLATPACSYATPVGTATLLLPYEKIKTD